MTLDELEKLLTKATPGPWDAHDYAEGGAGDRRYQIQERAGARRYDKTGSVLGYFEDEQVPTPEARANARLVAAMRNALPDLIAKARAFDAIATETGNVGRPYEDVVRAGCSRDGARAEVERLRSELREARQNIPPHKDFVRAMHERATKAEFERDQALALAMPAGKVVYGMREIFPDGTYVECTYTDRSHRDDTFPLSRGYTWFTRVEEGQ